MEICAAGRGCLNAIRKKIHRRSEYPDLQIVEGTHPFHASDAFKAGVTELTTQRAVTPQKMNDIVFRRIKIHTEEDG